MSEDTSRFFEARGYTLERELGRGGMGVVYLATQLSLSRRVAIKMLHPGEDATTHMRRFRGEAKALREIQHSNVVRLLDASFDTTPSYLVFEYIEGCRPLDAVLLQPPLPMPHRIAIMRGILDGLGALHARNVAHRDLKPANILLDASDEPRIIDFGIARTLSAHETRQTGDGLIIGTVAYMPPETILGEDATLAADVYSWALVATELLAGRPLFGNAGGANIQASDRLAGWTPPLREYDPAIDPRLERLIFSALDRNPLLRPPSALAALTRWSSDSELAPVRHPDMPTAVLSPEPLPKRPTPRSPRVPTRPPLAAPSTPNPAPTMRRHYQGAAGLASVLLASVVFVWTVRVPLSLLTPTPLPLSSTAPGSLAIPSAPTDLHAELQGTQLILTARTATPVVSRVTWKARDATQERLYPASTTHAIVLGDAGITDYEDLAVKIGDSTLDLPHIAAPLVANLERALKQVPVRTAIERVVYLRGRSRPLIEQQQALETAIAPALSVQIPALAPVARSWFLGTSDERRISYLRAVYQLEVLNSFANLRGLNPPVSSQQLLPPAWRMNAVRGDAVDNPRNRHVSAATVQTKPWGQLDGKPLSPYTVIGGKGWRYAALWLGSAGGYRPDKVGDRFFGESRPATDMGRTSWKLEFDLPPECAASSEVLAIVYAQEAGQGVLWVQFNELAEVPFAHIVGGYKVPQSSTLDWERMIPTRLLRPGRNTATLTLRPYPGLTKVDPIWIGWLYFLCYGPNLR